MIEKLKAFGDAMKSLLLWVITPLLVVGAGILLLLSKNRSLQNQVSDLKSNEKVVQDETKEQVIDRLTTSAVDDYKRKREQYLKNNQGKL